MVTCSACVGVAAVAVATGGLASPTLLAVLGASVAPVMHEITAALIVSGGVHAGRRVRKLLGFGRSGDALDRLSADAVAECVRARASALDREGKHGQVPDNLRAIAGALQEHWVKLSRKLKAARPTGEQIGAWIAADNDTGGTTVALPSPMDEDHWLALVVMAAPEDNTIARSMAAAALHAGFVPALLVQLKSDSSDAAHGRDLVQQAVLGSLFAYVREMAARQDAIASELKGLATGDDIKWALRVGVDTLREEARAQANLLIETLRPSTPPLYMPGRTIQRVSDDAAEEPIDEDRFDRFLFQAQRLPVVGREAERDELARWLLDGRAFSWDLWTGPAGTGKSRLALDLCITAEAGALGDFLIDGESEQPIGDASRAWRTGFIEWGRAAEDAERWKAWRPGEPTLIVVDYVAERAGPLSHVLGVLARRIDLDTNAPVRVLLLERDFTRPVEGDIAKLPMPDWVGRLTRHDLAKDGQLKASHARGQREVFERALTGVSLDSAAEIVRLEAELGGEALNANAFSLRLKAIASIDPALRPLFVAMAAEAIRLGGDAVGAQLPRWNPQLLAEYVQGKLLDKWDDRLGSLDVREVERGQLRRLLALATLSRGLDAQDLGIAFDASSDGLLPQRHEWKTYARHMLLTPGAHVGFVPPLEPDVIGEAFVLDGVRQDNDDGRELMRLAWAIGHGRNGPRAAYPSFLARAAQNFPKHTALGVLLDPTVEGAQEQELFNAHNARIGSKQDFFSIFNRFAEGKNLSDDSHQPVRVRVLGLWYQARMLVGLAKLGENANIKASEEDKTL